LDVLDKHFYFLNGPWPDGLSNHRTIAQGQSDRKQIEYCLSLLKGLLFELAKFHIAVRFYKMRIHLVFS